MRARTLGGPSTVLRGLCGVRGCPKCLRPGAGLCRLSSAGSRPEAGGRAPLAGGSPHPCPRPTPPRARGEAVTSALGSRALALNQRRGPLCNSEQREKPHGFHSLDPIKSDRVLPHHRRRDSRGLAPPPAHTVPEDTKGSLVTSPDLLPLRRFVPENLGSVRRPETLPLPTELQGALEDTRLRTGLRSSVTVLADPSGGQCPQRLHADTVWVSPGTDVTRPLGVLQPSPPPFTLPSGNSARPLSS